MDCEGKCFLNTQIIKEVTKAAGTKSENNPENSINFFTPHFISTHKINLMPNSAIILQSSFEQSTIFYDYSSRPFSPPDFLM